MQHTKDNKQLCFGLAQGARIRHRLRQPACKALCSQILEKHHQVLELHHQVLVGDQTSSQQMPESRQLMQQLKIRRSGPCLLNSVPSQSLALHALVVYPFRLLCCVVLLPSRAVRLSFSSVCLYPDFTLFLPLLYPFLYLLFSPACPVYPFSASFSLVSSFRSCHAFLCPVLHTREKQETQNRACAWWTPGGCWPKE